MSVSHRSSLRRRLVLSAVPLLTGLLLSAPPAMSQVGPPPTVPPVTAPPVPVTPPPACEGLVIKLGSGDEAVGHVCQMPDGRQCLVVASVAGIGAPSCGPVPTPSEAVPTK